MSKAFFDPLDKHGEPVGTPGSIGNFVTVDGVSRMTIQTPATAGQNIYLVVQWQPNQNAAGYWTDTVGVVTPSPVPQLNSADPVSMRPLRLSVRVRNTSQFTAVQGHIRVLNIPQQLDWSWFDTATRAVSSAFTTEVATMMGGNPSVRTYTAAELQKSHCWVLPPASAVNYREYQVFDPQVTNAQFCAGMITGAQSGPMNVCIIQIPYVATQQTYDISVHCQNACRFKANTLYAHLAREVRAPLSEATFTHHVQQAQQDASMGIPEDQLAEVGRRPRVHPYIGMNSDAPPPRSRMVGYGSSGSSIG